MEPPRKRPRLEMFDEQVSAEELDVARYQNDMQLKHRFELIFEKYSHDFTGIGDEVDISTGEIIVDNGHLSGMSGERDTGTGDGTSAINGISILRAMTEAPDREDSYFDDDGAEDVIMSIETIAQNAAITIDGFLDYGSEDDLFDQADDSSVLEVDAPSFDHQQHFAGTDTPDSPRSSDGDSLFDIQEQERLSSPDSLFGEQRNENRQQGFADGVADNDENPSSVLDENSDETAIIAKFGESVGQEVLELLEKRANNTEAHIEPAWRIPVKIVTKSKSTSKPQSGTPLIPPAPLLPPSPHNGTSLWRAPRMQKPKLSKISNRARARSESHDPLQEDFVSDKEDQSNLAVELETYDDEGEEYWDQEYRNDVGEDPEDAEAGTGEVEEDVHEEAINEGICPFCSKRFKNKFGVAVHFSRVVRNFEDEQGDDIHDIEYIRTRRGSRLKRRRAVRLMVCDFKTMVELHEGAGMTFEEISYSDVMKTQKTGARLLDLYNKHRSPQNRDADQPDHEDFTDEEDEIMMKLCENPQTTLVTLNRVLPGRTETEIGDRLAEMWLAELDLSDRNQIKSEHGVPHRSEEDQHSEDLSVLEDKAEHNHFQGSTSHRQIPRAGTHNFIKAESSDDDLFGG